MNWRAGSITLPLRLEEMKQIEKPQNHLEVKGHCVLITSPFSRGKSTVARGNELWVDWH